MPPDAQDIYCKSCGYNLRDRRSGECSECGEQFDREQGFGYRMTPISPSSRFCTNNIRLISGPTFLLLGVMYFLFYLEQNGSAWYMFMAIAHAAFAFISIVLHFARPPTYKG